MEKFNKKKLLKFLSKINLNGVTNKILIKNDDEKTFVSALDDNAELLTKCEVKTNLFDNEEEIGIGDVSMFMRYLGLFDLEELAYKFEKNNDNINSRLLISDKGKNLSYSLCHSDNIPQRELKKKPEPIFQFKFDEVKIKEILASLEVSGSKFFTFTVKKGILFLNIGDVDAGEHIIKIKIENLKKIKDTEVDKFQFRTNPFINILKVNSNLNLSLVNTMLIYESKDDGIETSYYQNSLVNKNKE